MKNKKSVLNWLPSMVLMAMIFGFSSIPSQDLPSFGTLDLVVKKGGHMLGFGLLALAYLYGLRFDQNRYWLALLLTMGYALTDEFHQSFVPGRNPSWVDAIIIDGGAAALTLIMISGVLKWKFGFLKIQDKTQNKKHDSQEQ
jgi:VanZ family protein